MRVFLLTALLAAGCQGSSEPRFEMVKSLGRFRRDAVSSCSLDQLTTANTEFETCIDKTTDIFMTAIQKPDSRPDFFERKICNSIEHMMFCFVPMMSCFPEDIKKTQFSKQKDVLDEFIEAGPNFDKAKCPYYGWFAGDWEKYPEGIDASSASLTTISSALILTLITARLL